MEETAKQAKGQSIGATSTGTVATQTAPTETGPMETAPTKSSSTEPASIGRKKFDLHQLLQTNQTMIVGWLSLAIGVALSSALGIVSYIAICLVCKIDELQMLQRRLLKTK